MINLTIFLGVVAALLHGTAYVLYNLQAKAGSSVPNPASWVVWAFLSVLNASSFFSMSGFLPSLQFLTGSAACITTLIYVIFIGKLSWPTEKEWVILMLGLLGAIVWWEFRSATGGNLITTAAFIISSVPTISGVKENPFKETSRPWTIWTIASIATSINVSLQHKWWSLVAPVVLTFVHGGVAFLSRGERKKKFANAH